MLLGIELYTLKALKEDQKEPHENLVVLVRKMSHRDEYIILHNIIIYYTRNKHDLMRSFKPINGFEKCSLRIKITQNVQIYSGCFKIGNVAL